MYLSSFFLQRSSVHSHTHLGIVSSVKISEIFVNRWRLGKCLPGGLIAVNAGMQVAEQCLRMLLACQACHDQWHFVRSKAAPRFGVVVLGDLHRALCVAVPPRRGCQGHVLLHARSELSGAVVRRTHKYEYISSIYGTAFLKWYSISILLVRRMGYITDRSPTVKTYDDSLVQKGQMATGGRQLAILL